MSLLRKVRVLVGALVHKPFTPRPERVDLAEGRDPVQKDTPRQTEPAADVVDSERVADLIARKQSDQAG